MVSKVVLGRLMQERACMSKECDSVDRRDFLIAQCVIFICLHMFFFYQFIVSKSVRLFLVDYLG